MSQALAPEIYTTSNRNLLDLYGRIFSILIFVSDLWRI